MNFLQRWMKLMGCGMCMGAADVVPGVSGGTVAFILGIYEPFINSIKSFNVRSIKSLLSFKFREFFQIIDWETLTPILMGIFISIISLAKGVSLLLGHEIYRSYLYSAFFGLIIASVLFCLKQVGKWKKSHLLAVIIGTILAFSLTGGTKPVNKAPPLYDVKIDIHPFLGSTPPSTITNYNIETGMLTDVPEQTVKAMLAKDKISKETTVYHSQMNKFGLVSNFIQGKTYSTVNWWLVFCGMLGASAMLLPGISGSYVLTILGAYAVTITAIADFFGGLKLLEFDFQSFQILFSLAVGIILGAMFFSRFISWLFTSFRDIALAFISGVMIGALRAIWPFWSYQYILNPLKLEKGPQLEPVLRVIPEISSVHLWAGLAIGLFSFFLVMSLEIAANNRKQTT